MRFGVTLVAILAVLLAGTTGCGKKRSGGPAQKVQDEVETAHAPAPPYWGRPVDGLVVGVASVSLHKGTSRKPVVEVFLVNRGNEDLEGVILNTRRFILEVDGKYYADDDYGGQDTPMPPGRVLGPILVDAGGMRQVKELAPTYVMDRKALAPVLPEGRSRIVVHYKLRGKTVASGEALVTVKQTGMAPELNYVIDRSTPEGALRVFWWALKNDRRDLAGSCFTPLKEGETRAGMDANKLVREPPAEADPRTFRFVTVADGKTGIRSEAYDADYVMKKDEQGRWAIVSVHAVKTP